MNDVLVRNATEGDEDAVWRILEPVFRAGETYAISRSISRADALRWWWSPAHEVFVAEVQGEVLGTYFLRPNYAGGGAHVANAGYVTAGSATGKGIAREMCAHSIRHAKERGFRAMQYNLVVSTNTRAVKLWQSFGFEIVGTLRGAFEHPTEGFVDAYVMTLALV